MHEHHIKPALTSEQQHDRMLRTPMPKLILSLSAPTVASQLISIIYNTADTYFVSQISTSASAAVGVVFSLQSIIQAYGFGVAMGASSLISLRLGEKKDKDADIYASSGFFAELVGGFLMLIFGLLFLQPLMRARRNGNDAAARLRLWPDYSHGRAGHVLRIHAQLYSAL